MYHWRGAALLVAIVLLLAGTATGQANTVEEIVAWVNADIILKSELDKARNRLRAELSAPPPNGAGLQGTQLEQAFNDRSKDLLRDLIDTALLLQVAKDQGLSADLELIRTMERMRQEYKFESLEALEKAIVDQGSNLDEFKQDIRTRYLTGQVLGREVYGRVIITNEELRKYYDENRQKFDRPEGIRIAELVVLTENRSPEEIANQKKKIEEALAAIKKGDDFEQVVQKYSEAPSARDDGDLGFFEKGQLNKLLEDAVANVEKGQTTDVLTLPYGFAILKVMDRHSGGVLAFELAQREIQDILFQQRVQPKIREYLTKLRDEGYVKTRDGYTDTGTPADPTKVSEADSRK